MPFRRSSTASERNGAKSNMPNLLPSLPFASGPWARRDRRRPHVGSIIRQREPSRIRETKEEESSAGPNRPTGRSKRLGSTLRRAQDGVSKLWKRPNQTTRDSDKDRSQPLRDAHSGSEKLERIDQSAMCSVDETFAKSRLRFLKPLQNLRKRRTGRPHSSKTTSEESVKIQPLRPSDETDSLPLSDEEAHPQLPTISHNRCIILRLNPEPLLDTVVALDETEGAPEFDVESTACIQPSVAESVVTSDERHTWQPPKPKKRKPRKPMHGDNSVLIGMVISFDPTVQLLDLGSAPRCIERTKLEKLQKVESYDDFLLGHRTEEEEPSEDASSVSDFLGFHLDCFAIPPRIEPTLPELRSTVTELEDEDDQIEIIFMREDQRGVPQSESFSSGLIEKLNHEEEIEIVFSPDPESRDQYGDSSHSSPISKYMDCRSESSDHTPLPLEWMLPESTPEKYFRPMEGVDDEDDDDSERSPPAYEWFHPDHLDVEAPKSHTPTNIFGSGPSTGKSGSTPSTMIETLSCDDEDSDSAGTDHSSELLSLGSLPSEAVQTLLDLCRS